MSTRNVILFSILVGLVAVWWLEFPSCRYRYRLTLEVVTPEGQESGSGVIEVHEYRTLGALLPFPGYALITSARGEAVAVDLGSRGTLFALLRSETSQDNGKRIVWDTFPMPDKEEDLFRPLGGAHYVRRCGFYGSLVGRKTAVAVRNMPMLVRFRDATDPKTVERVDPHDLAATFGAGVMLKSVTIEMVPAGWWPLNLADIGGEPVTIGIENLLAWLPGIKGGYITGGSTSRSAPFGLHGLDFQRRGM